ncbi:hypothetical protein HF998_00045 [Cellulomonas hominis]|nr:hypothetical protein [Cellulomonas hominis]MBB5474743.1 hypothetical protein [Cellulomonas hominis]NKY05399.1 hypothetical protein [Cellulomonas hominis]
MDDTPGPDPDREHIEVEQTWSPTPSPQARRRMTELARVTRGHTPAGPLASRVPTQRGVQP